MEKEFNLTATTAAQLIDEKLQPLIAEARKLWATVKPSILELGRVFVKMKKTFIRHKKNPITGQSYSDAVAETGVPYASSEFYRKMALTVDDPNKPIPQDTFLCLYDNDVNLASARFAKARDDERVTKLNAQDATAAEDLAKALKKEYPAQRDSDVSVDNLAKAISKLRAKIETDEDPVIRESLKRVLTEHQESAEELEESVQDKLNEIVQMLGGKNADDPAFPWAQAAQESLREKLSALKLA